MKLHREPLTQDSQIVALCERLRGARVLAFDTEFIRENTFYPQLEILQLATDSEAWIVDVRAFLAPSSGARVAGAGLDPLRAILTDPGILKVAHAIQADQECLHTVLGVRALPSIDTATAAGLCGYGDNVGLGNLLRQVLDINLPKGHARTNWAVRPLPSQLLDYALADVEHLTRLLDRLRQELDRLGRWEWALELSRKWEDAAVFEPEPEAIAERLSKSGRLDGVGMSALLELVRWREARVRKLNLPRRWVAEDAVLMDIAQVKPESLEHLSQFRGLNKGEIKQSGEELLRCIRRAREAPQAAVLKRERAPIPSASEAQVLDLLKCFTGILADRHRIALRYLVSSQQLLPLLRAAQTSRPEQWVEQEILSASAAKLVGQEIWAFLRGERALSIKNARQVAVVGVAAEPSQTTTAPSGD